MRRTLSLVLLCFLLAGISTLPSFAHLDRKDHYEEIEAVIFNNRRYSYTNLSEAELRNIHILEYATVLCIDQYGQTTDQALLDKLNQWGINGIPKSVADINPAPGYFPQLSPRNHRTYTHRGWDYNYTIDLAKWPVRKHILISAVKKVFGNNFTSEKQCESFAAVLYYIHLLGDYIEDVDNNDFNKFNGKSNGLKISFALAHPGETNRDIFFELEHHLKILFDDQANTRKFKALLSEIEDLAGRARYVVSQPGGINSLERLMEIKPMVKKLMDILTGENGQFNYIHELLKNSAFFRSAFPKF